MWCTNQANLWMSYGRVSWDCQWLFAMTRCRRNQSGRNLYPSSARMPRASTHDVCTGSYSGLTTSASKPGSLGDCVCCTHRHQHFTAILCRRIKLKLHQLTNEPIIMMFLTINSRFHKCKIKYLCSKQGYCPDGSTWYASTAISETWGEVCCGPRGRICCHSRSY